MQELTVYTMIENDSLKEKGWEPILLNKYSLRNVHFTQILNMHIPKPN